MKNKSIPAIIKWSGSKRSIAPGLSMLINTSKRFIDPFVGGGSILPFRKSEITVAGDVIPELISLWKTIQSSPTLVADGYKERWKRLQSEGYKVYYEIRDQFNETRNPIDLLFLSRTCVNGLIRFNKDGNFNNSLHHTRPGISPTTLGEIIQKWHLIIKNIEFMTADYKTTLEIAEAGDFVFLDPPYGGTRGRYIPNIFDLTEFYSELERLNSLNVRWLLTFDGNAGERSYAAAPPKELYQSQLYLATGKSPFTRLMGKSIDQVNESVYANFVLDRT